MNTKETIMRMFLIAVAAVAVCAVATPVAQADFGFTQFGGAVSIDGDFSRQAGAHADLTTVLRFTSTVAAGGGLVQDGEVRTVSVDLPPGVVGDPTAVPTCTSGELVGGPQGKSAVCPITSQIGLVTIFVTADPSEVGQDIPVYNMDAPPDLPGLFAFNFQGSVVQIRPRVRSTDYGITADVPPVPQAIHIFGTRLTLWAVPSDPVHDADRFPDFANNVRGGSSPAPQLPFLTNPTSCSGVAATTIARADSWQNPGVYATAAFSQDLDGTPFITDGCDRVPFAPSISVNAGSRLADAPTGLDLDITVPQSDDPHGLASAQVRRTVVTLPQGMSVSPSAAAGLGACSLAQIRLGSDDAPSCPSSSELGTVTIETPVLPAPLAGKVILAAQGDNPFRSLLAMYLVAKGPGVLLKLPGKVDLDPVSGQLTATFDNTPQLPFSKLTVSLRGGPRAPLATPEACGRYSAHAAITSWASDAPVQLDAPMVIDEGCGSRALSPTLNAGTTNSAAAAASPFALTLTRADRTAGLARIDAVLPPGLLARIGDVPQCPEPAATTGSCALDSAIGTTSVLSGPGDTPLGLTGRVYLTGPYKGAPFGLSIVVPTAGQAGPFDLGDVVVRAGISVDRTDAHVTVKSDPLPTIIQGIPLRLRQVKVSIDRPNFMFNPTNCSASNVFGGIGGTNGSYLVKPVPFRAVGCADLSVSQALALSLTGKTATTDGTHPGVSAHLTSPRGAANLKTASVALPLSLALDPDNAEALCTPAQRTALACPAASIVGRATAKSVLPHPLSGPVYFVQGLRKSPTGRTIRTLPKLWIPLSADGVTIDVNADSEVRLERLVTTFRSIPDAPIDSFDLTITGGKHGILVVSGKPGTCDRSKTVNSRFEGQNGKIADVATQMSVQGCKPHVVKSSATRRGVSLRIGGVGPGKLSVSGHGVASSARSLKAATSATVTAKLTKSARASLSRHHKLRVAIRVVFKPKRGASTTIRKTLSVTASQ
jgi:hypothetical protein